MEKLVFAAKTVCGALAGVCTALWGRPDGWLYALLACVLLDYVTGVTAAWMTQTLSSRTGFAGLLKKVLILLIAALANVMDTILGAGGVLRSMVLGFYIANEGLSLLENAARCGVPVPERLKSALGQLSKEG